MVRPSRSLFLSCQCSSCLSVSLSRSFSPPLLSVAETFHSDCHSQLSGRGKIAVNQTLIFRSSLWQADGRTPCSFYIARLRCSVSFTPTDAEQLIVQHNVCVVPAANYFVPTWNFFFFLFFLAFLGSHARCYSWTHTLNDDCNTK